MLATNFFIAKSSGILSILQRLSSCCRFQMFIYERYKCIGNLQLSLGIDYGKVKELFLGFLISCSFFGSLRNSTNALFDMFIGLFFMSPTIISEVYLENFTTKYFSKSQSSQDWSWNVIDKYMLMLSVDFEKRSRIRKFLSRKVV